MAAAKPVTIEDIKPTPSRVKDKTGLRIGKVEILGFSRRVNDTPGGVTFWVARCDCGKVYEISGANTHSPRMCAVCGRKTFRNNGKHGKSLSPVYRWWSRMKQRAAGRVCKRWLDFEEFYDDMGDMPENKPILHIPDTGIVNDETCFWTDVRNSAKYLDGEGMPTTLEKLGKELGVTRQRVEQKMAKARQLGVDEFEYLYSDHTEGRAERMKAKTDEQYGKYLVEGLTHHVFDSDEEAKDTVRRLASFVKSRRSGKINTRVLGNQALVKYEANG